MYMYKYCKYKQNKTYSRTVNRWVKPLDLTAARGKGILTDHFEVFRFSIFLCSHQQIFHFCNVLCGALNQGYIFNLE